MVLLAFFGGALMGTAMTSAMGDNADETANVAAYIGPFLTVVYLLFAVLYFFPVLYLYRFSVKMEEGLRAQNGDTVELAFQNLKSLFKFMGLFMAVILGFYGVMLVFGVAIAGISGMFN